MHKYSNFKFATKQRNFLFEALKKVTSFVLCSAQGSCAICVNCTCRNCAVWTSCANAQPTNSTVVQVVHADISKISSCTGAARQVPKNQHSFEEKMAQACLPLFASLSRTNLPIDNLTIPSKSIANIHFPSQTIPDLPIQIQ